MKLSDIATITCALSSLSALSSADNHAVSDMWPGKPSKCNVIVNPGINTLRYQKKFECYTKGRSVAFKLTKSGDTVPFHIEVLRPEGGNSFYSCEVTAKSDIKGSRYAFHMGKESTGDPAFFQITNPHDSKLGVAVDVICQKARIEDGVVTLESGESMVRPWRWGDDEATKEGSLGKKEEL